MPLWARPWAIHGCDPFRNSSDALSCLIAPVRCVRPFVHLSSLQRIGPDTGKVRPNQSSLQPACIGFHPCLLPPGLVGCHGKRKECSPLG